MKYVIIDNALSSASEIFEETLVTGNADDAIILARNVWDHLTKWEQKRRNEFFLVELTDEDYDEAVENDELFFERGCEIWRAK